MGLDRRRTIGLLGNAARLALLAGFWLALPGCERGSGSASVVVYASLDEHYSRPVLQDFEARTGIRVLDRYDSEADKTTGLYQRLLSEKDRPKADVFWNSEILRTIQLARAGALEIFHPQAAEAYPARARDREGRWCGFAARARVLLYHREKVSPGEAPSSIADLAAPRFRGKGAMALPLFGTTATHAGALRAVLGKEGMEDLFRRFLENGVRIVNGNAEVRDLVATGECAVGITDTDDAQEAVAHGKAVAIVFPDQDLPFPGRAAPLGTFLIPNTLALVKGGPNPREGKLLIEHLLSKEVEERLARSGSAQIPLRSGLAPPPGLSLPADFRTMEVDLEAAASGLEEAEPFLRGLFVR